MLQSAEKKTRSETGRKKNPSLRSVSIWLDDYDDLFSDFDPRNYSERSVSDDFIAELKRHSTENDFPVTEIKLLIPEKKRNPDNEEIISKRIHRHIQTLISHNEKKISERRRKGIVLTLFGFLLLISAGYVSGFQNKNFGVRLIHVVTEPAGWFFAWSGFEHLFTPSSRLIELTFYRKFLHAGVCFENL